MSRLIKIGITAARKALADAGTGNARRHHHGHGPGQCGGYRKTVGGSYGPGPVSSIPLPFIQSTYNTISSQIAINLKCHNYNSTYVHRSLSFESALQDGLMQLDEGTADNILAGGIDEMTLTHLGIIADLATGKGKPASNLELIDHATPGALAGEGAAFFVVGKEKGVNAYCRLESLDTSLPGTLARVHQIEIAKVLQTRGHRAEDIDLLVMGYNGDREFDGIYDRVVRGTVSRENRLPGSSTCPGSTIQRAE